MENISKVKKGILSDVLSSLSFSNVGEKEGSKCCCPSEDSGSKSHIYYPRLYLNAEQLPFLEDYEVGDDVVLVVKSTISSHSLSENDDKRRESYDLEIKEISCLK